MKYKIDIAPLADYYVVAVKDKKTSELKDAFTLNESGAEMLRLFCQDMDVQAVAQEISNVYEVPLDLVTKDVQRFVDSLNKKGLL